MFKRHMTPLAPHTKKGTLHNAPGKGSQQRDLPATASGGGPTSFQSYGKATPMAEPQEPAPAPDGLGTGTWGGNGIA